MNKLIKNCTILALSLFTGAASNGKTVDENTAKTVGSNYLISAGIQDVKSPGDLVTDYVATATANGQVITDYYVFNIKGGTGFIMVSADDNIIPILAYSWESSFDITTMAPDAKRWIDGYKNEITAAIVSKFPPQEGTTAQWNELKQGQLKKTSAAKTTSLFPSSTVFLLTTKWDQAPGYNNYCPGGSYTGCVATAMAQVMKFWNWPTIGTGAHTYTQNPNPSSYPAQTADFGNTAYNWTTMPLNSSNASVANLMHHCGISVDMNYSTTESGSWVIELESMYTNCAEYALKTYFHYKPSLRGVPRSGESGAWPNDPIIPAMSQSAWIAMLKAELDGGRPVIYSGNSTTAGGHCWVCDGYDASSNMHFNFGWSGASNGYYTVNSINPPAIGIGGGGGNFNTDQCAIIGVQPDSFPSNSGNIKMQAFLDCTTSSAMQYGSGFSFNTQLFNSNTTAFTGDICAQVFDTSDRLIGTIQTLSGQTISAGASSAPLTFSTTGMSALIPMDYYYIRVMYRATGTATWTPAANNGTFINYNILAVANSQTIELYDSLHVGNHTLIRGQGLTVATKVANVGTLGFSGTIQVVLVNVNTGTSYTVQQLTGQSIASGVFVPYSFATSAITAPNGTYILAVQHQPGGVGANIYTGGDLYLNPIMVNIVSPVGVNTLSNNTENILIYPNPANDVIDIDMQGVSVNEIRISDMQGREIQKINPGSKSVISVPVNNYAAGIYFVQLRSGEDVITKKIVVTK